MRFREVPCANEGGDDDSLMVIDVEASSKLHSNRRDKVLLRVGDENRHLTPTQADELLYDKGQAYFEGSTTDATVRDLDHELLNEYATALGSTDPTRLMHSRTLATPDGRLTVAGVLLFGEHPQSRTPRPRSECFACILAAQRLSDAERVEPGIALTGFPRRDREREERG